MTSENDIKALQEALDICGCGPGRHDGKMGPNTRSAIREFQKKAGIDVDGSVGPQTRQALSKHLSETAVRAQHLAGFFEGGGSSLEDDL